VKRFLHAASLLTGLAIGSGVHGFAQVQITIDASKDNTLYQSVDGSLSNGAGQHFFAGKNGTGSIRRGVIAFNVAAGIPAGSTITSVVLTLRMSQTAVATGPQDIGLYKALADWGEGTSIASGNEGGGAPSTANDATWLHKFFNTSLWASTGGEFSPTTSASQTIGDTAMYSWGSTAEMVSDVQQWLDTPSNNFGWLLKGNEAVNQTAKRFDTKENTTVEFRPKLIVDYVPPVSVHEGQEQPGTFALAQNYPNPFNPTTSIMFQIQSSELVTLRVYDALGREVATLVNREMGPGSYNATLDASNFASGIYYYRLTAGGFVDTKRMTLTK
jgi:hypothetical protein